MFGYHHWLNGHELEQALEDGEGQGSLVCCGPWSRKEWDTSEQLNNNSNRKECNHHSLLELCSKPGCQRINYCIRESQSASSPAWYKSLNLYIEKGILNLLLLDLIWRCLPDIKKVTCFVFEPNFKWCIPYIPWEDRLCALTSLLLIGQDWLFFLHGIIFLLLILLYFISNEFADSLLDGLCCYVWFHSSQL